MSGTALGNSGHRKLQRVVHRPRLDLEARHYLCSAMLGRASHRGSCHTLPATPACPPLANLLLAMVPVLTAMVPLLWPYRCARSELFERMPGVYLMLRFGPYIPLLFGIGALLFVLGLLVRIFAPNGLLRDLGSGFGFRYGVGAMLLAIALYAFMWVVEA